MARAGRMVTGAKWTSGGTGACNGANCTTIVDQNNDRAILATNWGVTGTPDVTPFYFSYSGATYFSFVAGGLSNATIEFTTTDFSSFTPLSCNGGHTCGGSFLSADAFLGPTGVSTDPNQGYSGIAGSWPLSNPANRFLVLHCENHNTTEGPSWWSVCAYQQTGSTPGSISLSAQGQIITSYASPPTSGAGGAGAPSLFIPPSGSPHFGDGYAYVHFLDVGANNNGPTQKIGVARCLMSTGCGPGNWTKYSSGSYSQPGLGGTEDSLFPHVDPSFGACCQSISWNTALQKYLALYFTGNQSTTAGYYWTTSSDLVTWSTPARLRGLRNTGGTGVCTPVSMMYSSGQPYGLTGKTMAFIFADFGNGSSPVCTNPRATDVVAQ